MKKILLTAVVLAKSAIVLAQHCCAGDSIVRELQFPLSERDTETVFYYFNDEWIAGLNIDKVPTDSIKKIEIKNDEYDNRAVFLTISPELLADLKAELKKHDDSIRFTRPYPRCEFPGGNGKLKEWVDENIRIPDGFKGSDRVIVAFTVNPDGTVCKAKIMRSGKSEAVNQEALRLVNAFPKFRVKYFTPKKAPLHYYVKILFKEPGAIFIRGDEPSSKKPL